MKNIQLILLGGMGMGMGGMGGGKGGGMMDGTTQGATGIMQMGMGIANAVRAKKAKKEMEDNTPSESDPRQVAIVDSLRRKRLSQQSGASTAVSQGMNLVNQLQAGARNKAVNLSGGNTGTLLAALSGSQSAADNQVNNLQAEAEKDAAGTMVLENQAQNDVVQRKMDVQMLKFNTANATYNAEKKAAQSNLAAGGANVIGGATSAIGGATGAGGGGGNYNSGTVAAGADTTPSQTGIGNSTPTLNDKVKRFKIPQG